MSYFFYKFSAFFWGVFIKSYVGPMTQKGKRQGAGRGRGKKTFSKKLTVDDFSEDVATTLYPEILAS